jgi:hypothetical protein
MILRLLALVVCLSFLFAGLCSGKEPVSDAEIHAAIKELSSDSSDHSFEVLYKNPQEATKILIAELKPTARGHYLSGKHPQVVWIIRALRSLTGLDFTAPTTAHLTDDEAHFLESNAQGKVEFFGTWMSRDSIWVAPEDAQIAIIKEWREWFALRGQNHTYVNDRNYDHWYF